MVSSEVQRTLVKSPPELWAELSDPKSLARHLGELGEIRITRAEPEKLVEWEAEAARGTVAIKASGWGTKVTLTASREHTNAEAPPLEENLPSGLDAWGRQEAEIAVTAAERFGHEHSATLLGSDLERAAEVELEAPAADLEAPEAEPIAQSAPSEPAAPEPRRGLFARLFGRGRRPPASFEALIADPLEAETPAIDEEPSPVELPIAEEAEPEATPEPAAVTDPEPATAELAAELKAAEEAAEEEVTAILKGVLDRLGAAHHRPFSRA
jgi:hypothetical protein